MGADYWGIGGVKVLLAAYTAALNAYDLDAVAAMFAEDAVYESSGLSGVLRGQATIMAAFRAYFDVHKNQINVDQDIEETGPLTLRARWHLRSGATARCGMQTLVFNADGKIASIKVQDDALSQS